MNTAPAAFRAQLRSHNRHAITAGVISGIAALILWNIIYFAFVAVLLGITSSVRGDFSPDMPDWIPALAFALAVGLFVWGVIDHWQRRFRPVDDRSIIGWHLFADFLLLPVRLTFAIWGNLGAVRRLSPAELSSAWELLVTIHRAGKARIGSLSLIEPDPGRLHRLLGTLQLMDYIDLHRGEQDWFYTVRSPRLPELNALMAS